MRKFYAIGIVLFVGMMVAIPQASLGESFPVSNPSGGTPVGNPGGGTPTGNPSGGTPTANPGGGTPVGNPGGTGGITLPNPLGNNGPRTLQDFVRKVLESIIIPLGAIIVVFFFILTGFKFVMARGNESALGDAKKMFFGTVIGAIIVLGAWAISVAIDATVKQIVNGL